MAAIGASLPAPDRPRGAHAGVRTSRVAAPRLQLDGQQP